MICPSIHKRSHSRMIPQFLPSEARRCRRRYRRGPHENTRSTVLDMKTDYAIRGNAEIGLWSHTRWQARLRFARLLTTRYALGGQPDSCKSLYREFCRGLWRPALRNSHGTKGWGRSAVSCNRDCSQSCSRWSRRDREARLSHSSSWLRRLDWSRWLAHHSGSSGRSRRCRYSGCSRRLPIRCRTPFHHERWSRILQIRLWRALHMSVSLRVSS